jgi:hypothetical protein
MHGPTNPKFSLYIVPSRWFYSQLYQNARIHDRQVPYVDLQIENGVYNQVMQDLKKA